MVRLDQMLFRLNQTSTLETGVPLNTDVLLCPNAVPLKPDTVPLQTGVVSLRPDDVPHKPENSN